MIDTEHPVNDIRAARRLPNAPPSGPKDIASILDQGVERLPDGEALVDAYRRYTYQSLDRAVDLAAARLVALGAATGIRVGCSATNGCNIVIAFLAAQRIGAIWVGLNRILPAAEKVRLAGHSGIRVFLGDMAAVAELAPLLRGMADGVAICELDEPGAWLEAGRDLPAFVRPAIDPHAIAAINYTSGTTGEPKGVLQSQHSLLVPAASITQFGLAGARCRRGVILPLTITNVMVVAPMIAFLNLTACVCGPSVKAAEIIPWIEQEGIEVFSSVPALVYDLAYAEHPAVGLKALLSGGAPLPLPTARRFKDRYGFSVTNSYGLTEAPTIVAETRGDSGAPEGSSGLPLPHLSVTIRDEAGRARPSGATGEICVEPASEGGWAGVYSGLLGYWRDPARTAALAAEPWLRTGDVGYLDENGWLFVSDRKADLILRGGSNVYPQEIARILEADSRVAGCAIVGVPDERLGERTFAFIQAADAAIDQAALIADLRDACRQQLSVYKCPDFWHVIPLLPRNPGGKVILPKLRQLALTLI